MSNQTYTDKAVKLSELKQAVKDYYIAALADSDHIDQIEEDIKDAAFDGTDGSLNLL